MKSCLYCISVTVTCPMNAAIPMNPCCGRIVARSMKNGLPASNPGPCRPDPIGS